MRFVGSGKGKEIKECRRGEEVYEKRQREGRKSGGVEG
jgi:hypothetical protein